MEEFCKINIYLMVNERTKFLSESINSILENKKNIDFNFIISDNSKTNNVCEYVKKKYTNIPYIKHDYNKVASQAQHFNKIIKNNNSEYIMLFHDDDIIFDNAIKKLTKFLDYNLDVGCVCPNAFKLKNYKKTKQLLNDLKSKKIIIDNKTFMSKKYLNIFEGYVHPLPGYLYRQKYLQTIERSDDEGKVWSDASFIIKLSDICKICWLNEPLFYCRFHDLRQSSNVDLYSKLSFLKFVRKNTKLKKEDFIQYKIHYLIRHLYYNKKINYKNKIYIKFLLRNYFFLLKKTPWILKKIIMSYY